jgi:hypothetical protein
VAGSLVLTAVAGLPAGAVSASIRDVTTHPAVVRVAVVVDFGPRSGLSRRVVIRCLTVPRGSNGTDVLADVADAAAIATPSYAANGLLCSIDGYPTGGCGTPTSNGIAYWSYWHGGTSWSYANVGPVAWTVRDGDVEGWRFDAASAGTSADPPPAAPAGYAAACATATAAFPITVPTTGSSSSTALVAGIAGLVVLGLGVESVRRWRRRAG